MIDPVKEFDQRYPDVAEAFRKAEHDAKEALFKSQTSDREEREQIYYAVRGLNDAKKRLMAAMDDKRIKALTEQHAVTSAKPGASTA